MCYTILNSIETLAGYACVPEESDMKQKRLSLVFIFLLAALAACGTQNTPAGNETTAPTPTAPPAQTETETPSPTKAVYEMSGPEFSFLIGEYTLTLRERDLDAKIGGMPLAPISDETEPLGAGSDTFTGSYVRTVRYEGLALLLFSPEGKNAFWLMQMVADSPGIETYRGIGVGDSLETLAEKYPEVFYPDEDGGTIYRYMEEYDELAFTVSGDTVTKITLTYYLP
jgi:hypothetical protein